MSGGETRSSGFRLANALLITFACVLVADRANAFFVQFPLSGRAVLASVQNLYLTTPGLFTEEDLAIFNPDTADLNENHVLDMLELDVYFSGVNPDGENYDPLLNAYLIQNADRAEVDLGSVVSSLMRPAVLLTAVYISMNGPSDFETVASLASVLETVGASPLIASNYQLSENKGGACGDIDNDGRPNINEINAGGAPLSPDCSTCVENAILHGIMVDGGDPFGICGANAVPTITLTGSADLSVDCLALYFDPGATASDPEDGDITGSMVVFNPVNTGVPGVYTVTYSVSDSSGSAAPQQVRTVTVLDNCPTEGEAESGQDGEGTAQGEGGMGDGELAPAALTIERYTAATTYRAGEPLQLTVVVRNPDNALLTEISVVEQLPTGWTLDAVVTQPPPQVTHPGESSVAFTYGAVPSFPLTLIYRVIPAESSTGPQELSGRVEYRIAENQLQSDVAVTVVEQDEREIVAGFVRDGRNDRPLLGAHVYLYVAGTNQLVDSGTTDVEGRYQLLAQASTSIDILFLANGFAPRRISRITAPATISLNLESVAPPAPDGVTASAGVDTVTLSWEPSRALDLAGYVVYRGESAVNPALWSALNSDPVREPRFEDSAGIVRNKPYFYAVTAVDLDDNESLLSEIVSVTPGKVFLWLPNLKVISDVVDTTELRVPVNVRNATGLGVDGLQLDLVYPAAWLGETEGEQLAATGGIRVEKTVLTQRGVLQVNKSTPGRVRIGLLAGGSSGSRSVVGAGHLFDVYLPIRPGLQAETCEVFSLENAAAATATVPAQNLPVDAQSSGFACVENTCFLGDISADGATTILDVILALQIASRQIDADACADLAAEMDGDGSINSGDALLIFLESLGLDINPEQNLKAGELSVSERWQNKGANPSIAVGRVDAAAGDVATVAVDVSGADGVGGLDLSIFYAVGLLTLTDVSVGEIAPGFQVEVRDTDGVLDISMSESNLLLAGSGTVLNLTFALAAGAPPGAQLPLIVSDAALRGSYGENLEWFGAVELSDGLIQVTGADASEVHRADWNGDNILSLSEVLRIVQFYNVGSYGCDFATEDGYGPGRTDHICTPHTADSGGAPSESSPDWTISLAELLRVIQLFNALGFEYCGEGEDGFCTSD
ncbi:MAG: DUF5011 domain-containing protein [Candidatus Hydrogenedens sp.]|nr:DUF5011 domain-containing protein [Candidatus Hydrogenedens sp.]